MRPHSHGVVSWLRPLLTARFAPDLCSGRWPNRGSGSGRQLAFAPTLLGELDANRGSADPHSLNYNDGGSPSYTTSPDLTAARARPVQPPGDSTAQNNRCEPRSATSRKPRVLGRESVGSASGPAGRVWVVLPARLPR